MKTALVIVSSIGIALVAVTAIHLSGRKQPVATMPAVESLPKPWVTVTSRGEAASEEPREADPEGPDEPVHMSVPIQTPSPASDNLSDPTPQATPFSRAIDTLVSQQASFQQKQAAWKELQDAGQLDDAIDTLAQGAAENPTSSAYPAALGQAQLYKVGEIASHGGTISEMGILGLQADQSFDTALQLEPANWEAQFFKAAAMSHWPLELNRGEDVIQRLSSLIDQQDTMLPQPQFARTFVLLGDQYQKMGESDHAAATWLIGAQRFPGDHELQRRIGGD